MTGRSRRIVRWAAMGAASGILATLALFVPEWFGVYGEAKLSFGRVELQISPLSLAPGMVFGLIAGNALRRCGLAAGWTYAAYVLASTLAYFTAVQISLNLFVDLFETVFAVGVAAGAVGASLLTGATAIMIREFRRARPAAAMILAGTLFGAALWFAIKLDGFFGWLLLFAPWQAAFAAAMATAPAAREH